jgi:hypothetical protein
VCNRTFQQEIFLTLYLSVQLFIACSIPLLLATFGMLYAFYKFFHPWTSEGISVGFEPSWKKHEEMKEDIYDLEDNQNHGHVQKEDVNASSFSPIHSSFQDLHRPGIKFHCKI